MEQISIRDALDSMRQSASPELIAAADAVYHYLETENVAAIGKLIPFGKEYSFREFAQAAQNPNSPDSEKVLNFLALTMMAGDSEIPVVRDPYYFPNQPKQTPAEDFAANFCEAYFSRYSMSDQEIEVSDQRLLRAIENAGVPPQRVAAFLLVTLAHQLKFGWEDAPEESDYFGCGLNIAYSRFVPPQSIPEWSTIESAVWTMDDHTITRFLQNQTKAPAHCYGVLTHRFGKFHGALATLRPAPLDRFIEKVTPEELVTVDWISVVRATDRYDKFLIKSVESLSDQTALHLLILIDTLRPGSCTTEALEYIFREGLVPDESALCYVRDQQQERLAEYFSKSLASPKELADLTLDTITRSSKALVAYWDKGGKDVSMSLARTAFTPTGTYTEGKASLQGDFFSGILDGDPPASDLREFLAMAEKLIEESPLTSKEKLESRRYFYLAAVSKRPVAFSEELWKLLEDRSKILRDLAVEGLSRLKSGETFDRATELLKSTKADSRSSAAGLLARMGDSSAVGALEEALAAESSEKVRASIHKALEASGEPRAILVKGKGTSQKQLFAEIESQAMRMKLPKSVPDVTELPSLLSMDGNPLSVPVITFLIAKQSKQKAIEASPDILPLLAHIDREKSTPFATAIVKEFLNSEQAASDRWALTLGGLLGDKSIIPLLLPRIQGWCENSRHKLAEYAAQAISLLPGDEPLMVLDSLSNKYRSKYKNIGRACSEAFTAAAISRGITPDELGDMVVPTFGFDEEGVRRFDWDGGGISAELGADFKLTWFDPETEKSWKSLPTSTPDEVKSEVKTITKLIRETVKAQTARLEMSLVRQRRWPVARWQELFENHPILRSFASGLVWGIYDASGSLLRTFRRYPNGILADSSGTMEELPETDTIIGMIHPLELDQAMLDSWRAHMKRMKVKQPFPQLDRPVEFLDPLHGNRREISLTKDRELSAGTFRSRAEKRGWTRGSVVDAGGISSYYKLYPGAGVEVNLPTEDLWIGCDPMDGITLGSATFAKAGTIERGSYIYNEPEPDDPRVLRFDQVPPVVYSETLSDLKAIIATRQ